MALSDAYCNQENINLYMLDTDRLKSEIYKDLDDLFNLN